MRRAILLTVMVGLSLSVGAAAQTKSPAQPATVAQPVAAPWANKFFLPDIATNRE